LSGAIAHTASCCTQLRLAHVFGPSRFARSETPSIPNLRISLATRLRSILTP
jgi:hypothetical protein